MRYFLGDTELQFACEPAQAVYPQAVDPRHRIRDFRARAEHPFFVVSAHVVEFEGVSLAYGRHTAIRPVVVRRESEEDGPRLVIRVGLRGHATARAEDVPGVLSHKAPGADLAYTPSTRTSFKVERDACDEAFEVNFTIPAVRGWARRYPELLEPIADRIELGQPFRLTRRTAFTTPALLAAIDAMMNSHPHGPLRELFLELKVAELLVNLLGPMRLPPPASAPDIDRMMEARDRVLARFDDPPTIAALARQVGTNAFRLKRDFKAVFGQSVRAFVLSYRLDTARALLLDTRRTIKEIAAEVGYSHIAHFSTAFKRHHGIAPSVLRERPPHGES
jgi:AraC-like DNA-binding protein